MCRSRKLDREIRVSIDVPLVPEHQAVGDACKKNAATRGAVYGARSDRN
jgi:hypothetical protein